MFTNVEFVNFVNRVYETGWVYWYGTCGYKCSDALYASKKKQYPDSYGSSRDSGYKADIKNGKMCADCVGMIKAFFWMNGDINGTNHYKANNCPDVSANGMIALCKETGDIKTIPDEPGLVVWKDGHIGVYVGNGMTIEMRGFAYDSVKRKVSEGPWIKWGRLPDTMLTYTGMTSAPETVYALGDRDLKKGDEGDDVTALQNALIALGYNLGTYGVNGNGVDGDYGIKTQAAVQDVQRRNGLTETGVADAQTIKTILKMAEPDAADEDDTPNNGSAPVFVLIIEGSEAMLRAVKAAYGGTLAEIDSVSVNEA